jgi:hypothetical protein
MIEFVIDVHDDAGNWLYSDNTYCETKESAIATAKRYATRECYTNESIDVMQFVPQDAPRCVFTINGERPI